MRNLLHISFFYFCFNFCWFSSFRSDGTKSLFKRKQIIIIWIKYCIKIIPHENTTFISFYWGFTFDPPFFLVWKSDGAIEFVRGWKKISFLFKDKTTNAFRLYIVTKKNTFMFMWVSVIVTLLGLIGNAQVGSWDQHIWKLKKNSFFYIKIFILYAVVFTASIVKTRTISIYIQ